MGEISTRVTDLIGEHVAPAYSPPFRGQVYQYASCLNLQAGYAVKGHFDIATARHLVGPLEALHDPKVRLVSVQGAVQTLKSLLADIIVPYWIEHDPGDILWLFEDDPKARIYAGTRAMQMIRAVPSIYRMLEDVDHSDKTKTKIQFSHCNLVMCGLNEGNVQSISYRYVIIDEAWMARANGLIRQAKARTTQYPDTHKILMLGQGGWEDEDFDIEHKATNCHELTFACPFCGFRQPFALSRERGEECAKELRGSYSGLSWDTNATTRPGGRWNYDALGQTAHFRCHTCDGRIEDRPEVRRQLAASFEHVITNPGAAAGLVGFQWPAPASTRIPWAGIAVQYLKAKAAKEDLSYTLPMQEFYQKVWGRVWSSSTGIEYRTIVHEPYDVQSAWPEESHRVVIADCQKDLQKFHVSVYAVSLAGEGRELVRLTVESFDDIAEVQTEWNVRDQHVFLDCGYNMTAVLRECVKHGHVAKVRVGKSLKKIWLCWTGLKGSGTEMFKHRDPKHPELIEWKAYSPMKYYDVNVGTNKKRGPRAPWLEWSNLHCKDLLRARRDADPGVPALKFLPDTLPPADVWSHWQQMRSEHRVEKYDGGKKRVIWVLTKEGRPNHEWDKASMLMAFMCVVGIISAEAPAATPAPASGAAEG